MARARFWNTHTHTNTRTGLTLYALPPFYGGGHKNSLTPATYPPIFFYFRFGFLVKKFIYSSPPPPEKNFFLFGFFVKKIQLLYSAEKKRKYFFLFRFFVKIH